MPKLKLYDAIFVEHLVDVPETCPKCGTVFSEGRLVEWDWTDIRMEGCLTGDGQFAPTDSEIGETFHACELACQGCGNVLAEMATATLGSHEKVDGDALMRVYSESREDSNVTPKERT